MSAEAALNMRPHSFLQYVASKGEGGDDHLGHLSTGDTVIPVEKTRNDPHAQKMLHEVFRHIGSDPKRFIVGHAHNKINHRTGLREFEDGGGAGGDAGSGGGGEHGGNPGDNGNGNGPGTGGDNGKGGGSNSPGTASETAVENLSGGIPNAAPSAEALAASPELSTQGISIGRAPTNTSFTGLSFIDDVLNNPVKSALNFGFGLATGPIGVANSLSGLAGGPTFGGTVVGAANQIGDAISAGGPGTSIGSGGSVGSGGGSAMLGADQASQDAEWLKRLGLVAGGNAP